MPGGDDDHVAFERRAVRELQALRRRRRQECFVVFFESRTSTPRRSMPWRRMAPADGSSCCCIRWPARWTTCTSRPKFCRPRAASSPSSPPPITAARFLPCGIRSNLATVLERAEHEHARLEAAGTRWRPSIGGRNGRLPVAMISLSYGSASPFSVVNELGLTPDSPDALPGVQGDVVFLVPGERIEIDLVLAGRAVEDVRQQDAVVVAVGSSPNMVMSNCCAAAGQYLLHGARTGHAVADDHQLLLAPPLRNLHESDVEHHSDVEPRGARHQHLDRRCPARCPPTPPAARACRSCAPTGK